MYKSILLLLLVHLLHPCMAQPPKTKTMFIQFNLGTEVSHVGMLHQGHHEFELHAISRFPQVTAHKMKGKFYPSGDLQLVEGYNYLPGNNGDSVLYQFLLRHQGDTTVIEQVRDGKTTVQKFAGKTMLANSLGGATLPFMPVLLMPYAPREAGQAVNSTHWVLGKAFPFTISRVDKNRLRTHSSPMGSFQLLLDENDNLQSVDAIGSSWNVSGSLLPGADINSLLLQYLQVEKSGKPLGAINVPATAEAKVGDAQVNISYSRPSARGRVVFGNIVPWNRVWRTGANAATKLTTDKTIYIGEKELPAGSYALFTLPTPDGWTLMVNRDADAWGTEYNPDQDVFRLPMQVRELPHHVEQMKMELVPVDAIKHRLVIQWEKTEASVILSVGK